jgi:hypothetical protein
MINDDAIEAFNNRLTADLNNIKTMTPAQLDRVKTLGTAAENLIKNRDLAQFIHQFKFDRLDLLVDIGGHTEVDNTTRVAISNQISGIDEFVRSLKRAVYIKNRVVSLQEEKLKAQNPEGPIN